MNDLGVFLHYTTWNNTPESRSPRGVSSRKDPTALGARFRQKSRTYILEDSNRQPMYLTDIPSLHSAGLSVYEAPVTPEAFVFGLRGEGGGGALPSVGNKGSLHNSGQSGYRLVHHVHRRWPRWAQGLCGIILGPADPPTTSHYHQRSLCSDFRPAALFGQDVRGEACK